MIKSKLKKILISGVLGFGIINSFYAVAQESPSKQISSLMQAGQFEQALSSVEVALQANPKDALLKFQRGVILSSLGRNDDAISEFSKLTEEYPQIPEPYNNLAVLYAAKGQLDKARASLELAIQASPKYATAYDNLGDVYTKLAAQYYEKTAAIDSNNAAAKSKLNILSGISNLPIGSKQVYNAQVNQSAPNIAVPKNTEKVTSSDIESKEIKELKENKAKKVKQEKKLIEAKNKTSTEEIKPQAENAVTTNNPVEEQEIIKAAQAWATAWSSKDINAYLKHYSNSFTPSNGSRAQWEEARKARISDKGNISVSISNPKVKINGDTAAVTFKQTYKSDKLNDVTQKTLTMTKVGGVWQIKKEQGN